MPETLALKRAYKLLVEPELTAEQSMAIGVHDIRDHVRSRAV